MSQQEPQSLSQNEISHPNDENVSQHPNVPPRRSRSPFRRSRLPLHELGVENLRTHPDPPVRPSVVDYDNVRYEFMAGKLIDSKMLHAIDEQQLYRYRVTHKNLAQYNCYILGCNAKLYLDVVTQICFRKAKQSQPHNHGPNDNIQSMQLSTTIKKRCRSAVAAARSGGNGNVRQIFHNAIREWVYFPLFGWIFVCFFVTELSCLFFSFYFFLFPLIWNIK